MPHKRILDLAVVFYCLLDNEYGRSATALIYNNNLKNWNVTIDDVYKAALKNTPDCFTVRLVPWPHFLKNVVLMWMERKLI